MYKRQGIDYFSNGPAKNCMDRGGFFVNHKCSCDMNMVCYKCGNGIVEDPHEECDDGNQENGDGCDSKCKREDKTLANAIITIAVLLILFLAIGFIFHFRAK